MSNILNLRFSTKVGLAPLPSFRIIFGTLMFFSTLRFWLKGWIYELYIEPVFHFKYYGFEWVEPLPGIGMYIVFLIMLIASLGIAFGLFYRIAALLFFLCFTYVELIDVANYLNHYYFVSLIAFLLIFLPANRKSSLDIRLGRVTVLEKVSWWSLNIVRLQLAVVYFYAGIAKLHPQWLLEALPLRIWLPAHTDMPLIGWMFDYEWIAYGFSWFGALYDLSIPFFLWNKKTRIPAFIAVITFHLLTWLLFPIGVFPWVMIFSTLIFFSDEFHQGFLNLFKPLFGQGTPLPKRSSKHIPLFNLRQKIFTYGLLLFLTWQLLWPWRFLAYPGNLLWTEQGYRLSWRVMLMEKAGYITYYITDPETGRTGEIDLAEYLTVNQLKQLATQPDLIVQFAHYLEDIYQTKGIADPVITAESYVTLNGEGSRLFIDKEADLTKVSDSFAPKTWILPYAH